MSNKEEDIIEQVLQGEKMKQIQSVSTDLDSDITNHHNSSDDSIKNHSVKSPQNISIIVNETKNYFTFMNCPSLKENPSLASFSFSTYNDETLVKLSPYLIKEQNGSRYLQKRIINDIHFANEVFFPYFKQHFLDKDIYELICDQFGNYLFQSLIESLEPKNIYTLISMLKQNIYEISINTYGTRVIQKLIEVISNQDDLLKKFISIIHPIVMKLLDESHGNHIIQKYMEYVKNPKYKYFLNKLIKQNFKKIATHKFGCLTIQKFLAESGPNEKRTNFELIKKNIVNIITNQYGSYVFQYIIEKEDEEYKIEILNSILPYILKICKTKYSSNAIEKCFELHCAQIQERLINKICENNNNIKKLILDPYGNYIIQKALCVCDQKHYTQIIIVIGSNTEKIKKVNFGYKLISKLLVTHHTLADYIITSSKF